MPSSNVIGGPGTWPMTTDHMVLMTIIPQAFAKVLPGIDLEIPAGSNIDLELPAGSNIDLEVAA